MQESIESLLIESGAVRQGHFAYASGRHGELYINKTVALVPSSHAQWFGRSIVYAMIERGVHVEAVVGPELGAITLMTRVADEFNRQGLGREVYGVIATKVPGTKPQQFSIDRDQARFVEGKKVLVVEDVLTSGGSARETVEAVRRAGGETVAAAALWNRGGVTASRLGVPQLFSLVEKRLPDYALDECPQCRAGIPRDTILDKG